MTTKPKAMVIWPDEVKAYAASAALEEARKQGWLTDKQVETIAERANLFMEALLAGKVLRPKDSGYDIVERTEIEAVEGDDDLVIEN